jgi:hypothetical protein
VGIPLLRTRCDASRRCTLISCLVCDYVFWHLTVHRLTALYGKMHLMDSSFMLVVQRRVTAVRRAAAHRAPSSPSRLSKNQVQHCLLPHTSTLFDGGCASACVSARVRASSRRRPDKREFINILTASSTPHCCLVCTVCLCSFLYCNALQCSTTTQWLTSPSCTSSSLVSSSSYPSSHHPHRSVPSPLPFLWLHQHVTRPNVCLTARGVDPRFTPQLSTEFTEGKPLTSLAAMPLCWS